MICSRCGKEIKELLVEVEQKINVYKITDQNLINPVGNVSEPTREYLCEDCFNRYADCLDKLNEDYQGRFLADMVEVVDDIQYGEE